MDSRIKNKIRLILLIPFILAGIGVMSLLSYFFDGQMNYLLIVVGAAFGVILWYGEVKFLCQIISETMDEQRD